MAEASSADVLVWVEAGYAETQRALFGVTEAQVSYAHGAGYGGVYGVEKWDLAAAGRDVMLWVLPMQPPPGADYSRVYRGVHGMIVCARCSPHDVGEACRASDAAAAAVEPVWSIRPGVPLAIVQFDPRAHCGGRVAAGAAADVACCQNITALPQGIPGAAIQTLLDVVDAADKAAAARAAKAKAAAARAAKTARAVAAQTQSL